MKYITGLFAAMLRCRRLTYSRYARGSSALPDSKNYRKLTSIIPQDEALVKRICRQLGRIYICFIKAIYFKR